MAESLRMHAENLADYLNQEALNDDALASYDILDALASLGLTLVEDPIADSTITYYETLSKLQDDPEENA